MSDESPSARFDSNLKHLPPHLQAPFAALKQHEAKIKELLATGDGQKLFLTNPVQALEAAGVKLDPGLRKAMLTGMRGGVERQAATFLFANGSTVKPKARIRIV